MRRLVNSGPGSVLTTLMVALMLAGCAPKGDLGRGTTGGSMTWAGLKAKVPFLSEERPKSATELTEDEKALRRMGDDLLASPLPLLMDPLGTDAFFGTETDAEDNYFKALRLAHIDSPDSLLASFSEQVALDIWRAREFNKLSRRVAMTDDARLSIVRENSATTKLARDHFVTGGVNVLLRADENGTVVEETAKGLKERLAGYRYALARAKLEIYQPGKLAEIEQRIGALAELQTGLETAATRYTEIVQGFFAGTSKRSS